MRLDEKTVTVLRAAADAIENRRDNAERSTNNFDDFADCLKEIFNQDVPRHTAITVLAALKSCRLNHSGEKDKADSLIDLVAYQAFAAVSKYG